MHVYDQKTRHLNRTESSEPMPSRTDSLRGSQMLGMIRFVLSDLSAVFDVPVRSHLLIGRKHQGTNKEQVDIDLSPFGADRLGVSRYHAIIQATSTRVVVKDFNSTNGTYLNGYSLNPMEEYRLRDGDELTFGHLSMKVQFLQGGA